MGRMIFDDPVRMPDTGQDPEERFAQAQALHDTPGRAYVERRGIPVDLAHAHGVRFDADFAGRPAVVAAMRDRDGRLVSLHGRYLQVRRGDNKMLTVGPGDGLLGVGEGWRGEPLVVVEGLFDALSVVRCGWSAVASVGRWASWLPDVAGGRTVWLAFDNGRPGEADARDYQARLPRACTRRLPPPGRAKDWNTALVKRGPAVVRQWLEQHLRGGGDGR
jgi:hypothetical protein